MRGTGNLKGMRDVRGMRSVGGHSKPASEESAHIDMHRLITERSRLQRELNMWRGNVERLEKRLADIEGQLQELDQFAMQARQARQEANEPEWQEMTLNY